MLSNKEIPFDFELYRRGFQVEHPYELVHIGTVSHEERSLYKSKEIAKKKKKGRWYEKERHYQPISKKLINKIFFC